MQKTIVICATVLLGVLFIGGSMFSSQFLKQRSIEKQRTEELKTRKDCSNNAKETARELLLKKIQMGATQHQAGYDQGLVLKVDRDKSYNDCLSINGLK